jgi:hypothetical protein
MLGAVGHGKSYLFRSQLVRRALLSGFLPVLLSVLPAWYYSMAESGKVSVNWTRLRTD